jgi:hypothetical protein
MDSQFNTLIKSYSDNFIQHKVTGSDKFKKGYESSEKGIESILSKMEDMVNEQKQQISDFYKSGIQKRLSNLDQRNSFLERRVVSKDDIIAAEMRNKTTSPSITFSLEPWQYITLGLLGATAVGLSVL